MKAIYEPKGKALEYSPLACNLFTGCRHACKYCYCPAIKRQTLAQWSAEPKPRPGILAALEHDAKRLGGMFPDKREVLFCFMSDPYQSKEAADVTTQALRICADNNVRAQVLTKGGSLAIPDFELIRKNGFKFGSTIIFCVERDAQEWEPGAAPLCDRADALKDAHARGIHTWVSVEPVIYPEQAVEVIRRLKPYVSFWKIGKLNHNPDQERSIDWAKFLADAEAALGDAPRYIKHDLLVAAGRISHAGKRAGK